ncbi:MAG: hypothetical protein JWR75_1675 [Devosia sp.]|nr:hypothetical protein [Devosia sp.]
MLLHTPYDGSSKLFAIGLKPLDLTTWIDVDADLGRYLAEKARVYAAHPSQVFAAEPDTDAAQREVLTLLAAHLPECFPKTYRRYGNSIVIIPTGCHLALAADAPPLWTAAQLVQEDFCLMRNGPCGWRLVAGALAFPSSWSLPEKLGRPMHEIHAPVPGFGAGTRHAELIERMFTYLRVDIPVIRWNFSLYGDDRLFHPETANAGTTRFGTSARAENVFLRVERQTLRKLPASGDILFTIRIYVDPLTALERHDRGAEIAASLIVQLQDLDAAQLAYKGLTLDRDRLVARLTEFASPA